MHTYAVSAERSIYDFKTGWFFRGGEGVVTWVWMRVFGEIELGSLASASRGC